MSLLTIVTRVARRCGLTPPTLVLGSGDETWLQMAELAQEVVDDLSLRHDWRGLHKTQTLTGDGSTVAFTLATDYARLSKMPAVSRDASTMGFWPVGPLSPSGFISANSLPVTATRPSFQIEGGTLTFVTAPALAEAYTVSYQSSKAIYSSAIPVTDWLLDADTPLVPDRLVRLGMIWRWKADKGLDYAEHLSSFERALEQLASADWSLMPLELSNMLNRGDEFGDVSVTV